MAGFKVNRKKSNEKETGLRICRKENCWAEGKPQPLTNFKANKQQHLNRDIYCKKCRSKDRGKYYHRTGK